MASSTVDEAAVANATDNDGDNGNYVAPADTAAVPPKVKRVSPGRDAARPKPLTFDFRPFTLESMQRIKERIDEEAKAKQLAKELKENPPGADEVDLTTVATPVGGAGNADKGDEEDKPQPNPLFEAGKPLLPRFGKFPQELYGKPIEDVDEYYHNKYVSVPYN